VRKELVRPDPATIAADEAYRFRHLLVRDAAYESLPKASRAMLHERFASWLEEFGADLVELDEIVGYHLEQAALYRRELGEPDSALGAHAAERLAAAAERAWRRHDAGAAASLGERAVALFEDDDDRRLALLPTLALALHGVGRMGESLGLLAEAREAADAITSARARFLRATIAPLAVGEGFDTALAEVRAAIEQLEPIGDPGVLAEAFGVLAQVLFWHGRITEQQAAAERAQAYARDAGDLRQEAWAVGMLASAAKWGPMPWENVDRFARAMLADATRLGPLVELCVVDLAAMFAEAQGRFDESREGIRRMQERFSELGMEVTRLSEAMDLGHVEQLAGDLQAAEEVLREGWVGLGELGEHGYRSTIGAQLGWTLVELGRLDEAAHILNEAAALASSEDFTTSVWVLMARSAMASRRGEHEDAVRLANEAVAVLAAAEYVTLHVESRIALGQVLIRADRADEARAPLADALARAEAKGALVLAESARELLAQTE
jgi:tetratricopeptide (TPR) repeat protein